MAIHYIALDIGNVCLQITPERAASYFAAENLWQQDTSFWQALAEFECGRQSEDEFLQHLQSLTPKQFSRAELLHGWNLVLGEEIAGMADFVQQMRERNCQMVFFSDTSSLHLQEVRRKLSFASLVTEGIYSFEVGARKPNSPMYEAFEQLYGVPVLYLDDRLDNITAAQQRGWNAVQCTNPQTAWKAVREHGKLF